MTDFSKILFRASGAWQLMVDPKEKSNLEKYNDAEELYKKYEAEYDAMTNHESKTAIKKFEQMRRVYDLITELKPIKDEVCLSETTKTYLIGVMINEVYGRRADIMNKYVQKGLMVEEDAITLLSRVRKQYYQKNELHLENDFMKGTPDLFEGEDILRAKKIIDIKSSFDIFTFFKSKFEQLIRNYYWQLQVYMDLTGATESEIAFCLVDTPDSIVEGLKRRFMWDAGIKGEDEFDHKAFEEIDRLSKYGDIDINERYHIKKVERNQEDIDRMHERVITARQWMELTFKPQ